MTLQDYVDAIKLELTGGVLELEITDETLGKVVMKSLREIARYMDTTRMITIPYANCIDMSGVDKINSIVKIYRTEGFTGDSTSYDSGVDPMYAERWMAFSSGGTMYNLQNYLLNYMSWNTLLQLRNTTTTDLTFKYDDKDKKLYINVGYDIPTNITIEYVPNYTDVEDVISTYWQEILQRLSIAMTKQILGRIRSRYKQTNALWEQDGETMLSEGTEEIKELREVLRTNSQSFYPID